MIAAVDLLRRLLGPLLYTHLTKAASPRILAHLSDPALLLLRRFSSHLTPAAFFKCACIMRRLEEPTPPIHSADQLMTLNDFRYIYSCETTETTWLITSLWTRPNTIPPLPEWSRWEGHVVLTARSIYRKKQTNKKTSYFLIKLGFFSARSKRKSDKLWKKKSEKILKFYFWCLYEKKLSFFSSCE